MSISVVSTLGRDDRFGVLTSSPISSSEARDESGDSASDAGIVKVLVLFFYFYRN